MGSPQGLILLFNYIKTHTMKTMMFKVALAVLPLFLPELNKHLTEFLQKKLEASDKQK